MFSVGEVVQRPLIDWLASDELPRMWKGQLIASLKGCFCILLDEVNKTTKFLGREGFFIEILTRDLEIMNQCRYRILYLNILGTKPGFQHWLPHFPPSKTLQVIRNTL